MVINTKRLSIICSATSDWVDVTIYPNYWQGAKTTISYDEDTIESDVEISELIAIFNGEPTWRRQFLSGHALEGSDENDELYPYKFKILEKEVLVGHKLDAFTVTWNDLWIKGVQELKFMTEDFTSGSTGLSIKTLIRLEALKRIRQAFEYSTPEELAFMLE